MTTMAKLKPCKMTQYETMYRGTSKILPELRKAHKDFIRIEYVDGMSILTVLGFSHPKKDFIIKEI